MKRKLLTALFCFLLLVTSACAAAEIPSVMQGGYTTKQEQTDVQNAEHVIQSNGIPYLNIEGIGKQYQPAFVALYALEYAGEENYFEHQKPVVNEEYFWNCIDWLCKNATILKNGDVVWLYHFDNTYNDLEITSPWYSGFGQAVAIEALLEAYGKSNEMKYLELAKKGATVLFRDCKDGGLLYRNGDDVWFEEIAVPADNPPHILNGHMRVLIALKQLAAATQSDEYETWYDRGTKTLAKWMPLYDNNYWISYDLNPKKNELLFRFYRWDGGTLPNVPIESIEIADPNTGEKLKLDIGSANDASGDLRIAGNDWLQSEVIDGKTVRRLKQVEMPAVNESFDSKMNTPGTFFYLKLPSEWRDNLRSDWLEMTFTYKDEAKGRLNIQTRSIAPGDPFRNLRDGELLLTGSGEWRTWKVPLRPSDLHYWMGEFYMKKYLGYISTLNEDMLYQWKEKLNGYYSLCTNDVSTSVVTKTDLKMPQQTMTLPIFSFDSKGVMRMHYADDSSDIVNGKWREGAIGPPTYSPYIIATQAQSGNEYFKNFTYSYDVMKRKSDFSEFLQYNWLNSQNINKIQRAPALEWIKNNYLNVSNSAVVWTFDFNNAYNDVSQKSGWQSAFAQRYVIDVLLQNNDENLAEKAANAYAVDTKMGGLASYDSQGAIWFEEVPNNTHILNAHIASLNTLRNVYDKYHKPYHKDLYDKGSNSLKENIHKYDCGNWSKYDMNPKKEVLFQLDWLEGTESPLISSIELINPQTKHSTIINVGDNASFEGMPRISGVDWKGNLEVDGEKVRGFYNKKAERVESNPGESIDHVYIFGQLPDRDFADYFDVPPHILRITLKDVAKSTLKLKCQSINEGNYLKFSDIGDGVISLKGDNQWKTIDVVVEPQYLGWYMGPDYQKYHNEQMFELSKKTGDWFFKQYYEKWTAYMN